MTKIIARPFKPNFDSGFIFSTWPKGVYHSSMKEITVPKKEFFQDFYEYIKHQLANSEVTIACIDNDPDTILGYSIISNLHTLQYIYTKELFRKQGIASLLLKNKHINSINMVNLTKLGAAILIKHPELNKKKEEENESDPS